MKNMTAQFVTKRSIKSYCSFWDSRITILTYISQDYKKILTLLNGFHTATESDFKDMLNQLQFPFVYDDETSLAENRRQFKDFFLA
jgi:hypothetical protein